MLNSLKRCAIFSSRTLSLKFFIPLFSFKKETSSQLQKKYLASSVFLKKWSFTFFIFLTLQPVAGVFKRFLKDFLVARVFSKGSWKSFWLLEFLVARMFSKGSWKSFWLLKEFCLWMFINKKDSMYKYNKIYAILLALNILKRCAIFLAESFH